MAGICKNRTREEGETNYHIFLNSVRGISAIIREAGLLPEDARIICSRSEDAARRNQMKLPDGFSISSTVDPVKTINFYTSTCFEGQDIYDENGRAFIVSDGFLDQTKLDISTSVVQILGRIRNSIYRDEIVHLYSTSRYKDVTPAEFEARMEKQIKDAKADAELLNSLSPERKKKLLFSIQKHKDPVIDVIDGNIVVDENMKNLEIVNYNIVNGTYKTKVNMNQALADAGFEIADDTEFTTNTPTRQEMMASGKTTFKETFELYASLRAEEPEYTMKMDYRLELVESTKPLVKEAYDVLGADKVREMKYHQSNIKQELIKARKDSDDVKIVKLLDSKIKKQEPMTNKDVKQMIQDVYDALDIRAKAKATDLCKWYDVKKTERRVDGKNTACLVVYRSGINMGI